MYSLILPYKRPACFAELKSNSKISRLKRMMLRKPFCIVEFIQF